MASARSSRSLQSAIVPANVTVLQKSSRASPCAWKLGALKAGSDRPVGGGCIGGVAEGCGAAEGCGKAVAAGLTARHGVAHVCTHG